MSLGLMSGDLIVNINGLELDDPMKAMSIFQNIENDSQVTLTIIRNENPTEIFINSDQFNEST
jgi:type II secretory pathway component PulC